MWTWLNGKKTALGLLLVSVPQLGEALLDVVAGLVHLLHLLGEVVAAFGGDPSALARAVDALQAGAAAITKGVGWIGVALGSAHKFLKEM